MMTPSAGAAARAPSRPLSLERDLAIEIDIGSPTGREACGHLHSQRSIDGPTAASLGQRRDRVGA